MQPCTTGRWCSLTFWLSLLLLEAWGQGPVAPEELPYSLEDLKSCNMTSKELLAVSDFTTEVKPCILYDTMPSIFYSKTTIITIVGVFNSNAGIHRDGALIAVQKINQDNDGRGAAIGYYRDHYIQFQLVIGVSGNRDQMGPDDYFKAHATMLQVFLEELKPQYILGTSSFDSELEREFAGVYQTMLLAQVGPNAYYTSERSNNHVFGAHIPSEGYGIPAFQALRFSNDAAPATQKIRVVFRDRSEFFKSTCKAVVDKAIEEGYNLTKPIEYNPDGDADGDGMLNHQDLDFLMGLADQACSPEEAFDGVAIWGCFLTDTEVNTFLNRLKANQCRLSSLWLTVASWAWPNLYPLAIPLIQSGGQWHASMQYEDEYFANGQEMLDHMEAEVGYTPDYSALGAYHAIYLMFANIRSFFKGKDEPTVAETFASAEGYEEMRRAMLDLSLPRTLYGPTSFDENRRNVGRGSAGMQWNLPTENHNHHDKPHKGYELLLVSPVDQATKGVSFPSPAAKNCRAGSFVNVTQITVDPAILNSKCDLCPVDSFSDALNEDTSCRPCVGGASTRGEEGSNICIKLEDNLVPSGLLVLGYSILAVIYSLAIGFAAWTIRHRDDPVVRIGQLEFLLMICLGPMISSSSIIFFGIQAGSLEDDTAASRACRALPFLYTTGWILQYGSLSAKTYRMYNTMKAAAAVEGRVVSAIDMYMIILVLLLLDWAIVIPWTIFDPLQWRREEQGTIVDQEAGVMIFESYGRCYAHHMAAWFGSTLGLHVAIMFVTNYLLYKIRHVSGRYQESKYVAMASAYACEFFVVGIPILVAVGEKAAEAYYIVLVCIVGLSDLGILLMIFVPKIMFAKQGLPEGVTVGQSIYKRKSRSRGAGHSRQGSSCAGENLEDMSVQLANLEGHGLVENTGGESVNNSNSMIMMIEGSPDDDLSEGMKEQLKKEEEGALVNCMTQQW